MVNDDGIAYAVGDPGAMLKGNRRPPSHSRNRSKPRWRSRSRVSLVPTSPKDRREMRRSFVQSGYAAFLFFKFLMALMHTTNLRLPMDGS